MLARISGEQPPASSLCVTCCKYYLAFTTKTYDTASKFTCQSISLFDRQQWEAQAEFNTQWSTYEPQLEYQLLQHETTLMPLSPQPTTADRSKEEFTHFKQGVSAHAAMTADFVTWSSCQIRDNTAKARNEQ